MKNPWKKSPKSRCLRKKGIFSTNYCLVCPSSSLCMYLSSTKAMWLWNPIEVFRGTTEDYSSEQSDRRGGYGEHAQIAQGSIHRNNHDATGINAAYDCGDILYGCHRLRKFYSGVELIMQYIGIGLVGAAAFSAIVMVFFIQTTKYVPLNFDEQVEVTAWSNVKINEGPRRKWRPFLVWGVG